MAEYMDALYAGDMKRADGARVRWHDLHDVGLDILAGSARDIVRLAGESDRKRSIKKRP